MQNAKVSEGTSWADSLQVDFVPPANPNYFT